MKPFEIKDPTVNSEEIQAVIAERIKERRREAQKQALDFDDLAQSMTLERQTDEVAVEWMLNLIESRYAAILIEPYTIPSDQGKIKTWLGWLKKQLHNLVIYYVNMLARRQISINQDLAWTVATQRKRLARLQRQVDSLEREVQRLKKRPTSGETASPSTDDSDDKNM